MRRFLRVHASDRARRRFLVVASFGFATLLAVSVTPAALGAARSTVLKKVDATAAASSIPVTGSPVPVRMEPWIAATQQIMRAYKLPGASLAVAYEGKVVLDDGLGYADLATKQKATPTTMFRLGSVSKSLTAAVAWELVDEGKLSLAMKPFATVLSSLRGPHGAAPVDPRVRDITLGEILTMTTGFEDATDPTADSGPAERALGLHSPPNCVQAIEYELGQRLSFAPGSKYQYVNFNYCVLAEVISKVTDMSFARAAHELLTGPLHMGHTMLGAADPATLLPGEAHYYGQGYEASGPSSPSEHSLYAGQAAGGVHALAEAQLHPGHEVHLLELRLVRARRHDRAPDRPDLSARGHRTAARPIANSRHGARAGDPGQPAARGGPQLRPAGERERADEPSGGAAAGLRRHG